MKQHIWSLLGQFSSALFGLVTFVFLARNLGADVFGAFLIYLSATTFLEMVRLGVLHTAVVRGLQQEASTHASLLGSAWILALILTVVLTTAVFLASAFLPSLEDFRMFFKWYWLSALAILPYDFGLWIHQANKRFKQLTLLRVVNLGSFALFASLAFWIPFSLEHVIMGHIATSALASSWAIISGHSGALHIFRFSWNEIKRIWDFGKYSMGTFMGTALLKTADTVLIGSFLGSTYVAAYGLATKMLEALEIPLRALVGTALPSMSYAHSKSEFSTIRSLFYQYSGWLSLLFLPLLSLLVIFAPLLLPMIGGNSYSVESLLVCQILALYGLLLPLDRFLGVTLDALGIPKWNMIKVSVMSLMNIVGDIAVLHFDGGIEGVAWVTVVNIAAGVIFGIVYLNRSLTLSWYTCKTALSESFFRMAHLFMKATISYSEKRNKFHI